MTTTADIAGELGSYLSEKLGHDIVDVSVAYGQVEVTVAPEAWQKAARLAKSDPRLACHYFDWLCAVDLGDEGFAVVCNLISTEHRHSVRLRTLVPGGREEPALPTLTGVYRGANWHEREAYDMFGVTFPDHPNLLPRILTVENFEGWPLRKDFLLTSREVKPWPGAKEPEDVSAKAEVDPRIALEASDEDKARMRAEEAAREQEAGAEEVEAKREEVDYDQEVFDRLVAEGKSERVARAKAKAAAMRARKAGADSSAGGATEGAAAAQSATSEGDETAATPEGAAEVATADMGDPSIAKDAAAGVPAGDVAAGAPGDVPGEDEPVPDSAGEASRAAGASPESSGSPGVEAEGRHGGAVGQRGDIPADDTPGMDAAADNASARAHEETPAPGPESDVAGVDPHGAAADDRPVTPAPGSEVAAVESDETAEAPQGDEPEPHEEFAAETDDVPPPSKGTDAARLAPEDDEGAR